MRAERLPAFALVVLLSCSGETHSLGAGRDAALAASEDAASGIDVPDDAASDVGLPPGDAASSRPMFEAPRAIAPLDDGSASDDDPSLTQDLTELYFNSQRDGGEGREDIWFTTRPSPSAAWGAPRPARELNSEARETGIALSADGLTIWFSSDRPGGAGGLDIYSAKRASRAEPFAEIARSAALSSGGDDLVSSLDQGASSLYFARREDEDDDYDLFVARRAPDSPSFDRPEPIAELNSTGEESDAFAVARGARLLFTRAEELVLSARGVDGTYAEPTALAELNSDRDDRDVWTSEDLGYLVFSSNRAGSYLLYESRRSDPGGDRP